jgi:hypothetical protein
VEAEGAGAIVLYRDARHEAKASGSWLAEDFHL